MNKCIAVDIDEVLVPFLPELTKFQQKRSRRPVKMPLRYPYHYAPLFKITEKESTKLVADFYNSEEHAKLKPLTGSKEILDILCKDYILVAVTGRQEYARDATERLLSDNFGSSISDIVYCNHFTDFQKSKADVCYKIGADLLIDDSLQSCVECLYIGLGAINFIGNPVYPWCEKSAISAIDWFGVFKYINNNRDGIDQSVPGYSDSRRRKEKTDSRKLVEGTGDDFKNMGGKGGGI